MADDGARAVVRHVREQAASCAALGSPLYAALLGRAADDLLAGGPVAAVLAGHEDDPGPSALALRLAGAVHRLVLTGRAPDLAAHYPSTGGDGDAAAAWPAFRRVLAEQGDAVRAGLDRPPQTNEVGRCAGLLPAVLRALVRTGPRPVRLWEVGTSAGLNLRADAYRYETGGRRSGSWGDPASPVRIAPAWQVPPPWLARSPARLDVVERVGADLHPVDPLTPDGALTLTSFVWPDQADRLARLRAALEVARAVPARVVHASAADVLEGLEPVEGTLTAVQHSVVRQYLEPGERTRVERALEALGRRATRTAPVAHVALEPERPAAGEPHRYLVTLRTWPGGEREVLGEAQPHGAPVVWEQSIV